MSTVEELLVDEHEGKKRCSVLSGLPALVKDFLHELQGGLPRDSRRAALPGQRDEDD